MRAILVVVVAFTLTLCTKVLAQDSAIRTTDQAQMESLAWRLISSAEINMIGARGAAQVSQVADQAQLNLALIRIRQNDEIIRLLRKIAKE
ncbi:MAG: hypothetical protein EBT07_11530 [Actinobacteria bacterium]|nr:hypothetical protein [Actinomycetota bacterium]